VSYTTLQTKLAKLKNGDRLPLDMLRELADCNPHWSFYKGKQQFKLADHISLVSEFRFRRWTESTQKTDGSWNFHEAKGNLTFKDGTKATVHFDQSSFYKMDVLGSRYRSTYFSLLKPGKLAIVAEEVISLLTEHEMIMDGIDSHQQNRLQVSEGTPVMVLKTLMFDSIPLVKVLCGEEIRWTYGVLYDKDTFDANDNDNHWL